MQKSKTKKLLDIENRVKFKFYSDKEDALAYIRKGIYDFDEDLFSDILTIIIDNDLSFNNAINNAKSLYSIIVFDKENSLERNLFLKFFNVYREIDSEEIEEFKNLYSLFEDKKLFLVAYEKIEKLSGLDKKVIYHYIEEARRYYADETMFFSSLIELIDHPPEMYSFSFLSAEKDAIETAKKQAGVYPDLTSSKLQVLSEKQEEIKDIHKHLSKDIESLSSKISSLKDQIENSKEDVQVDYKNIQKLYKKVEKLTRRKENTDDKNISLLSSKLDGISKSLENDKEEISKELVKKPEETSNILDNELLNLAVEGILSQTKNSLKEFLDNDCPYSYDSKEVDEVFKENLKSIFLEVNNMSDLSLSSFKDYLKFYYYSLYNYNLDLFHRVMENIQNISELDVRFFSEKYASYFDTEDYISLICTRPKTLKYFIDNNDVYFLSTLISINSHFSLFNASIDFKKLESARKIFKISELSLANEVILNNISLANEDTMPLVRYLNLVNPNFKLENSSVLTKGSKLFEPEEIANLTGTQQFRISNICDKKDEFILENKNTLRKIILSENEVYFPTYRTCEILNLMNDPKFSITIDEYLKLDHQEQKSIVENYYSYVSKPVRNRRYKKVLKDFLKNG